MTKDQIKVGLVCFTKIGDERVRVFVKQIVDEPASAWRKHTRTAYRVARCDDGKVLPKLRAASALHEKAVG